MKKFKIRVYEYYIKKMKHRLESDLSMEMKIYYMNEYINSIEDSINKAKEIKDLQNETNNEN